MHAPHFDEEPCTCPTCRAHRDEHWLGGIMFGAAIVFVAAICNACVVSTERPMSGHWEVTHTSMTEFCPAGQATWAELDLGDDFEARSIQGELQARGAWSVRGNDSAILKGSPGVVVLVLAILKGSPVTYTAELSSHDGVHMGGLITVDVPSGGVCSYAITLEER